MIFGTFIFQRIIIPEEVFREVVEVGTEGRHHDAASIGKMTSDKVIIVKKVKNMAKAEEIAEHYGLAKGESEAISLSVEIKDSVVALDDLKAIRYCDKFSIPFTTTINIVLEACKNKTVGKKEAKQMIKNLAIHGRYKNEVIFYALGKLEGDGND